MVTNAEMGPKPNIGAFMTPTIYKRAARRIAEGKSSCVCYAIGDLTLINYYSHTIPFHTIFLPEKHEESFYFGSIHYEENQLARSLALLFCYHMAKDGVL